MSYSRGRTTEGWSWPSTAITEMTTAWTDWADEMAGAFDSFVNTMTDQPTKSRRRHRAELRARRGSCGDCAPDTCHCDCCVYDADLVVYTRVAERRIVPIRVSNERTRTRHITLELSEFTTSGGSPAPVVGTILTAKEFDLEACEREDVVLLSGVGAAGLSDGTNKGERFAAVEAAEAKLPDGRLGDVDDCVVAYADLRIQGCDVRPLRIAVAVLPRDCDAYEVHCACGCC